MKPTFYQWLQQYKDDDTAIGDLSRVVSLDRNRPRSNKLAMWEQHVVTAGGSDSLIELLRETWEKYELGLPVQLSDKTYHLKLRDERWEIKRPALPNWSMTGRFSSLIHVRMTPEVKETLNHVRTVSSPMFCAAVEQFGRYFRREFGYDFLPYTIKGHTSYGDGKLHPYLFFDQNENNDVFLRPIGACGFERSQNEERWVLTWIWMHPFARRRGHLSKVWVRFREWYRDFAILPPVSPAMAAFLNRYDRAGEPESKRAD